MNLANYGQTVKKMEEAAYRMGDSLFHSLIFLLEPNQVFLTLAILPFLVDGRGKQEGLAEFKQKIALMKRAQEILLQTGRIPQVSEDLRCVSSIPACAQSF